MSSVEMAERGNPRRLVTWFWASLFAFYCATGTGHSSLSDGYLLFLTARSLLDRGEFAIPLVFPGGQKLGVDGEYYSKYGAGLALAHVPMLLAGRTLGAVAPALAGDPEEPMRRDEFFAQFTNAWVMATAVTWIFLSGVALGFGIRPSLAVATLAGLASPLWLYARIDGTEALQAMSLGGAVYFALHPRRGRPGLAGVLLGLGIATKPPNVLLVPWFIVYWLSRNEVPRRRVAACLRFLAPVLGALVLVAMYDHSRFGNALDTGFDLGRETFSQPLWKGAAKMLFAPSYGLVFFWPSSLLLWSGGKAFAANHRREAILLGGIFATLLVLYGGWWAYWGVHWGPRLLVPALPLLSLFLLPLAAKPRGAATLTLWVLSLVGLGVQVVAVGASYWTQVLLVHKSVETDAPRRLVNDPRIAPLRVGSWWWQLVIARELGREDRFHRLLEEPPWHDAYPWKPGASETLERVVGLDLWAAPQRWRMPTYSRIWPGETAYPILSSGILRLALLTAIALSLLLLVRGLRGLRDPPAGSQEPGQNEEP